MFSFDPISPVLYFVIQLLIIFSMETGPGQVTDFIFLTDKCRKDLYLTMFLICDFNSETHERLMYKFRSPSDLDVHKNQTKLNF